ncbi:hypothetical protein GCM10010915_12130 [Microbacterium faecale]|uniref:YqaJ viral recombinase domain-containing protein n=1 Tax=Microbacterium faecale TaxID=1804630 RepID=A0A917DF86_9MICO|nr:YqaJ viral recombinase family protein [Microbacterium faecale]GGD33322.1 hypothetical protein GCM10010915_12130 [Microbacterium faecale]
MILETQTREEWLTARRGYVTATDIARLANGGPVTWAQVRAEKGAGLQSFPGNRYTEYGREREPFIVDLLTFLYDVAPNDQVHVLDGTQWAATPDAISPTRTGEVKTSVRPLGTDAGELRGLKTAYYDQVQWAMLAADRGECAFAWELNDNFTPGPGAQFLIPRDEDRIGELIPIADEFLTYLADGDAPGEWDDLLAEAAQVAAEKAEVAAREADVQARIRERAGDEDLAVKSPLGSISLAYPRPRRTFDQKRFQADHPDLAAEYMTETAPTKRTLRITPKG